MKPGTVPEQQYRVKDDMSNDRRDDDFDKSAFEKLGFDLDAESGSESGNAGDTPTERYTPPVDADPDPRTQRLSAADTPTPRADVPTERYRTPAAPITPPVAPTERYGAAPTPATERYGAPRPPATERFGSAGFPLATQPPASRPAEPPRRPTAPTPPSGPSGPSKGVVGLLIAGGILLAAAIVLLVVLVTRQAGDTTAAPPAETESSEEAPAETAPETPEGTDPEPEETNGNAPTPIESFEASTTTVDCSAGGEVPLDFSWSAIGETLWFGFGEGDVNTDGTEYPLVHDLPFSYLCGQPDLQQIYTITVDAAGYLTSESITVTETAP